MDLDPASRQTPEGVLGETGVGLGQDAPSRLDQYPPGALVRELRVALERVVAEVLELGERLDPCVAAADEEERQERAPPFRISRLSRGLETGQDVVAEVDRLFDRLEADGPFGEPGDGQDAAHRPR